MNTYASYTHGYRTSIFHSLLYCLMFLAKASIQLETQHPEGMRRIQQLEAPHEMTREEAERVFEKPIFTQILTGPSELWEGQNAHFEARVVPVGDPTLRFEWYVNGIELKLGKLFLTFTTSNY